MSNEKPDTANLSPTYARLVEFSEAFANGHPNADVVTQQAAAFAFICRALDNERESRENLAKVVTEELAKLKRKTSSTDPVELLVSSDPKGTHGSASYVRWAEQVPNPIPARAHMQPHDSLSRSGTGHPSERCCKRCGRPTFDLITAYQSAKGEAYCSRECYEARAEAIACGERMPPAGARVLFFVPSAENAAMRWKAGYQLPNGYGLDKLAQWSSDEGDHEQGHVTYTAEQVTHWMAMPEEPTQ